MNPYLRTLEISLVLDKSGILVFQLFFWNCVKPGMSLFSWDPSDNPSEFRFASEELGRNHCARTRLCLQGVYQSGFIFEFESPSKC